MTILCTFPGRHGDLLWALPTIRAIAETVGHPVDLQIAGEFAPFADLLRLQPYLGLVIPDSRWSLSDGWQAPPLTQPYDRVIHLGYRRWPELPLPMEIWQTSLVEQEWVGPLDLRRPWITAEPWTQLPHDVVIGFSDCWFELKVGLLRLLGLRNLKLPGLRKSSPPPALLMPPAGSRWVTEWGAKPVGWIEAARRIAACRLFLGDCSALHVLAVAMGKPVLIAEPMEARWNPIFYPLGIDGPQVTVVKGLDDRPTWDARHVAEALEKALCQTKS